MDTSFDTTNTTALAAPFSFTVTVTGRDAVYIESILADLSTSSATTYYFQPDGAARGAPQTSSGDVTVYLDQPVLLRSGQSQTFTLILGGTNLVNRCFNDFTLQGRVDLTTDQARFSQAAGTNAPPAEWTFYWNKPDGWVMGGSGGDRSTGAITNRAAWAPLAWSGTQWTPDGDDTAITSPASYLRIHGLGGHPGEAGTNQLQDPNQFLDRYAIAAYRVPVAGDYQIGRAFVQAADPRGNGVKVIVFKNGILQREFLATSSAPLFFSARLNDLAANDEIAIAVGPNGSAGYDTFKMDYSIALATPTFPTNTPVFDVANFGAVGNGIADDYVAVSNALAAASASTNGGIVRFDGAKTYRLVGPSSVSVALSISGKRNLRVEGNGAKLSLLPPKRMVEIYDSQNICVDGFEVNYSPLPYFQGTITGANVNNRTIDIHVPDRYPVPPVDPDLTNTANWSFGRTFVPNSPGSRVGSGSHLYIDAILALDGTGRNLRIYAQSQSVVQQAATTATEVVVPARNMGQTGNFIMNVGRNARVLLANITVHAAPQFVIAPISNLGPVTFNNVDILVANPSTELFVSWRDGWHVKDNRFGITIKNGDWNGGAMNDDLFNFSTVMGQVVGISNQTVNVVMGAPLKTWFAGDWVRLASAAQDVVRGYARIASPTETIGTNLTLVLDQVVPGLSTNDVIINEDELNRDSLVQDCRNYALGTRSGGSGRIRTPTRFDRDDFDHTYFWLSKGEGDYLEGPVPANIVFSNTKIDNSGGHLDVTSGRNLLFSGCIFTNTTLAINSSPNSNIYIEGSAWVNQAGGNLAMTFSQTQPAYIYGNTTVNGSTSLASWIGNYGSTIKYSTPDPLQTPSVSDYDSDGLADWLETPAGLKNPDTDGDGLPDGYEYEHGLNPADAADAAQDRDGDGVSNLAEYQAGTDPNNAAEVLKADGVLSGGIFTVAIHGKAGRQYTLWRSASLQAPWQAVDSTPQPLALSGEVTLRDAQPSGSAAYYRLSAVWMLP
ncbi:MAG: hypothetical protein ACTHLW_14205 [Verrucomicrobiota bacterium]